MIYNGIEELIGKTPIMRLGNYMGAVGAGAELFAKLECFNPAGSAKDRIALSMICAAEADGTLKKDSVIIEPTSGNTGIGLASIGTARGYRVILTMPDTMSLERRNLVKAYGAEVVLTEGALGMDGAVKKAEELAKEPGGVILGQFENPANPEVHYKTTGPEIWEDMNGEVDVFVAGIGTGGTISGVGKYLKEKKTDIKIVAVEPASSPLLSKGKAGAHKIQGIGANFVPKTLDTGIYDLIVPVPDDAAIETGNKIAKTEGILVGISGGAAVWAAAELSKKAEFAGKKIVALLTDTGERYLSTGMFD